MSSHTSRKPVLMIALDAAEVTLIERWTADGTMPRLRELIDRGVFGKLQSTADWLAGSVWPTFYTGTWPAEHGFYFHLQWRPELMKYDRPRPDWLPLEPFHHRLGEHALRSFVFDLPLAYAAPEIHGVEIMSWVSHDKLVETSIVPPSWKSRIDRHFGSNDFPLESGGLHTVEELLWLRDKLIAATDRQAAVCTMVMAEEHYDFGLVCLGATHRGGHKLWNRSILRQPADDRSGTVFDGALREVYASCDRAIGRLVDASSEETTFLVASLHGMGDNRSCSPLVPEMLSLVLHREQEAGGLTAEPHRWLGRLRRAVPLRWRTAVKTGLPAGLQDRLSLFWRAEGHLDWSKTRAFAPLGDLQGAVSINLKGREAGGVVEPGSEYEELCEQVIAGMQTFVDADTGDPIVGRAVRSRELYPDAVERRYLPDLLFDFEPRKATEYRALSSPEFGTIEWPNPGHPLEGYAGHHLSGGWVVAAGPNVATRRSMDSAHIVDLNTTIHRLLGLTPPIGSRGRTIQEFF